MLSGFLQSLFVKTSVIILALLGSTLGTVKAQSSDAEQLFVEGVGAFEKGEYPEAIRQFQAAFRTQRQPNLAYNIARCFERMGDLKASGSWYRTYRSFNPPDALAIESKILQLQTASELVLTKKTTSSSPPSGLKPAAVGVGLVGALAASVLGGMAMYYSGRSEETSNRERQGIYARDAESYALATDLTLLVSFASLAYGGTIFLKDEPSSPTDQ